MRFILSALLATGLAGCGMIQQYQFDHLVATASDQRNNEDAACNRQFPDHHAKPTSPRTACFNRAEVKYRAAIGDPNDDLGRRLDAEIALASENYDAGKLTVAQFDLAKADAVANFTTALHQRTNGDNMVAAAQYQAAAAQQAAGPRTCRPVGNSVMCY